jgi:Flp pilus assembly protein TadG
MRCDSRAAVMPIVGLTLMVLLTAGGMAVDAGRAQLVQSKLSSALDAAGLAAGANASTADVSSEVQRFVEANFPNSYMSSTLTDVSVGVSSDNKILELTATATVPTTLMRLAGYEDMTVTAVSEITRETKGMELVLVMDNTGSMAGSGKMGAMQQAAHNLIDILYGDETELENFWVALVPYVTAVNIGPAKLGWVKDYDQDRYTDDWPSGHLRWKGCVEARSNGYDVTDDPPNTSNPDTLWNIFFWEDHDVDNDWIENNGDVDIYELEGYSNSGGRGPNIGCGPAVTPFTSQKSDIDAAIDEMAPWRRGGTMSSTGLAWGWRILSPRWRGLWDHEEVTLPLDYEEPLMEKVVIILTDGENQFYDASSDDPPLSDYTAYQRIDEELISGTSWDDGRRAVNDKTEQICTAMKDRGILIYTITFRLTSNSTSHTEARELFRSCATSPDYYYNSPDNATLQQTFQQIGDSLANLRISR